MAEPAPFTSMFTAMGTPDLVLDADSVPTPGEPGATGTSNYRINSTDDIICYDITLPGVTRRSRAPRARPRTSTRGPSAKPARRAWRSRTRKGAATP